MKPKPTHKFLVLPIIATGQFTGSSANAAVVSFANFDGTPVAAIPSNGHDVQLTATNLDAGTTTGTWAVNQVQNVPTGRTQRMIQTDGGANVTNKALRFGISFNGAGNVDNALIPANLTSNLSLSNTINVSFDQGMISADGGAARRTFLTGLDGSNMQLFQIGFAADKRLVFISSTGVLTTIGTIGDLAGNNNTYWDDVNMKTITVDVSPSTYDIKLNGVAVTG